MHSINNDILKFFEYLDGITNMTITSIELKPIKIKDDTYISGFKLIGEDIIEAHIKRFKTATTNANGRDEETILKDPPSTSMWLNIALLTQEAIQLSFNGMRDNFYGLKNYEIIDIAYTRHHDHNRTYTETIIYDDKRTAYKDIIEKRRNCYTFQQKIIHWNGTTDKRQPTAEELIDMPYDEEEDTASPTTNIENMKTEALKKEILKTIIEKGTNSSKSDVLGDNPIEDMVYTKRINIGKDYGNGPLAVNIACVTVTNDTPSFDGISNPNKIRINAINPQGQWCNIFLNEAPKEMVKFIYKAITQ